jgi:hypothetical protein
VLLVHPAMSTDGDTHGGGDTPATQMSECGSPGRLPLADLPADDASLRVAEWARAHAQEEEATSYAPSAVQHAHGHERASAQRARSEGGVEDDDAPLRQRGVRFAEDNDAYADVRSELSEQQLQAPYAGQVDALEESKHEGAAWLESSAPSASVLAGAPRGGPSKPEAPKPKAISHPKAVPITHPWLRIGDNGELNKLTTTAKYKMASKLGVKPRDLRFLEMPVSPHGRAWGRMGAHGSAWERMVHTDTACPPHTVRGIPPTSVYSPHSTTVDPRLTPYPHILSSHLNHALHTCAADAHVLPARAARARQRHRRRVRVHPLHHHAQLRVRGQPGGRAHAQPHRRAQHAGARQWLRACTAICDIRAPSERHQSTIGAPSHHTHTHALPPARARAPGVYQPIGFR